MVERKRAPPLSASCFLLCGLPSPHTRQEIVFSQVVMPGSDICMSSKSKPQDAPQETWPKVQNHTVLDSLKLQGKSLKLWAVSRYPYHRLATPASRARSLIPPLPMKFLFRAQCLYVQWVSAYVDQLQCPSAASFRPLACRRRLQRSITEDKKGGTQSSTRHY